MSFHPLPDLPSPAPKINLNPVQSDSAAASKTQSSWPNAEAAGNNNNPLSNLTEKVAIFMNSAESYWILTLYPMLNRNKWILVSFVFFCLWMCATLLLKTFYNAVTFIYPVVKTVKAIESPRTGDDTEWLMYWVVYASFSCIEFFSDILLSWIPFYFFLKCLFLLWCMYPSQYNGSKFLYKRFIRPFVLKNEDKIDQVFSYVSNNVEKMADQATSLSCNAATSLVQKQIMKKITKLNSSASSAPSGSRTSPAPASPAAAPGASSRRTRFKNLRLADSSDSDEKLIGSEANEKSTNLISDVISSNVKNLLDQRERRGSNDESRKRASRLIKTLIDSETAAAADDISDKKLKAAANIVNLMRNASAPSKRTTITRKDLHFTASLD